MSSCSSFQNINQFKQRLKQDSEELQFLLTQNKAFRSSLHVSHAELTKKIFSISQRIIGMHSSLSSELDIVSTLDIGESFLITEDVNQFILQLPKSMNAVCDLQEKVKDHCREVLARYLHLQNQVQCDKCITKCLDEIGDVSSKLSGVFKPRKNRDSQSNHAQDLRNIIAQFEEAFKVHKSVADGFKTVFSENETFLKSLDDEIQKYETFVNNLEKSKASIRKVFNQGKKECESRDSRNMEKVNSVDLQNQTLLPSASTKMVSISRISFENKLRF